jgi:Tol biopolymer transport system component
MTELWVMNIDGTNLKLLDHLETRPGGESGQPSTQTAGYIANDFSSDQNQLVWSDDSRHIAYHTVTWDTCYSTGDCATDAGGYFPASSKIMVIDLETRKKTKIFSMDFQSNDSTSDVWIEPLYDAKLIWAPDTEHFSWRSTF